MKAVKSALLDDLVRITLLHSKGTGRIYIQEELDGVPITVREFKTMAVAEYRFWQVTRKKPRPRKLSEISNERPRG